MDVLKAAVRDLLPFHDRHIGTQAFGIALDELVQHLLLLFGHLHSGEADGFADIRGLFAGIRLAECFLLMGYLLLILIQGLEEIAGIVLGLRQEAFALVGPALDFRRAW